MIAAKKRERPKWTKATTTCLVAEVFESFFPKQLDNDEDESKTRVRSIITYYKPNFKDKIVNLKNYFKNYFK